MTALIGTVLLVMVFVLFTDDDFSPNFSATEQQLTRINWSRYDQDKKLLNIIAEKVDIQPNDNQVLIHQMQAKFYYETSTISINSRLGKTTTKTKIIAMPYAVNAVLQSKSSTVIIAMQQSQYKTELGALSGLQVTIQGDGYWLRGDNMQLDDTGTTKLSGSVRARF